MLNYALYQHRQNTVWVTFVHGAGGSSSIWFKQVREYRKHYNVLLLDLRGHGNSKQTIKDAFDPKYTFDSITEDIVEVIDRECIKSSHFIGISLGTILIRNLAEKYPDRVDSMIMGGAIMKLNFRSQVLMRLGIVFRPVIPYMFLYKFFAFIIMPKKNHKESRLLFTNEAKKLCQKEFVRWFRLTSEINPLLQFFRDKDIKIPTLYVMGEEDYLFLPSIKKVVSIHEFSNLFVVRNSGHVVNVEQSEVFNEESLAFIQEYKS